MRKEILLPKPKLEQALSQLMIIKLNSVRKLRIQLNVILKTWFDYSSLRLSPMRWAMLTILGLMLTSRVLVASDEQGGFKLLSVSEIVNQVTTLGQKSIPVDTDDVDAVDGVDDLADQAKEGDEEEDDKKTEEQISVTLPKEIIDILPAIATTPAQLIDQLVLTSDIEEAIASTQSGASNSTDTDVQDTSDDQSEGDNDDTEIETDETVDDFLPLPALLKKSNAEIHRKNPSKEDK